MSGDDATPRSVGVLLAAGTGTRFDEGNKLLATVDGEPMVARAAETLVASSVDDVVAVVGHEADRVAAALPEGVAVVENADHEDGQSTSVRRGVDAARARDAVVAAFALGDMPCVTPDTVDRLLAAHESADADIVVPTHESRRGNPVVVGERHFDALAAVDGDRGGRALFDSVPTTRVAVDDPGVRRDVDTPEELAALRQSCDGDSGRP